MKLFSLLIIALLVGCGPAEAPDSEEDTSELGVDEASEPDDRSDDDAAVDDVGLVDTTNAPEDDEPVDDPGVDLGEPGSNVSLATLFEPLFVANGCTAGYCHGGFGSADAVFDLVGAPAGRPVCGRTEFVVPGEPEQSVLWLRIRDTTDEDIECEVVKMPAGRTEPLDPELTQMVYDWIAQGANR